MTEKSRASVSFDLDSTKKQTGCFGLPWSRDESGWGTFTTPLALLTSGKPGPTVTLTAGNHGDEYEGIIVLHDLIRSLDVSRVQGRIFVVPTLNHAAVEAGKRLSPIDGANMNRAFVMRRNGTMTEQVAHFVESELVARSDAVLDIHSGGKSMMFSPFAVSHQLPDAAQTKRAKEALLAFGAPIGLILEELDSEGMLDSAVENAGKLFISTELGGGGTTSEETLTIARRGLNNFLVHTGVLDGEIENPPYDCRLMTNDADGFLACEKPGLVEYLTDLGGEIQAGQPFIRMYELNDLNMEPWELKAPASGKLLGRIHNGLAERGDFLALIGRDL